MVYLKTILLYLVALGGDVKFFVGSSESATPQPICDLEVIVLNGVRDEDYPPQIKSFAMLKWMEENHKNRLNVFQSMLNFMLNDISINLLYFSLTTYPLFYDKRYFKYSCTFSIGVDILFLLLTFIFSAHLGL